MHGVSALEVPPSALYTALVVGTPSSSGARSPLGPSSQA